MTAKQIQLKDRKIRVESCVRDCRFYIPERCGCFLIGIKSYGFCGNDPNPRATPPLPECQLPDWQEELAQPKAQEVTTGYLDKEKIRLALVGDKGIKCPSGYAMNFLSRIDSGEFDANPTLGEVLGCTHKAIADKDAEITHLKEELYETKEQNNRFVTYIRKREEKIQQQEKELAELRKQPPQKEPELFICPNAKECKNGACNAREPHEFMSLGCEQKEICVTGLRSGPCIPVKEPEKHNEPLEPDEPCDTNVYPVVDVQQAHTAQIEALQDRVDKIENDLDETRTGNDKGIVPRVAALESRVNPQKAFNEETHSDIERLIRDRCQLTDQVREVRGMVEAVANGTEKMRQGHLKRIEYLEKITYPRMAKDIGDLKLRLDNLEARK